MDELIYSIIAIIFALTIGIFMTYILYLKEILNKNELKRGIINIISFGILSLIIIYVFFNFSEILTIVVGVICIILWISMRQIVKERLK